MLFQDILVRVSIRVPRAIDFRPALPTAKSCRNRSMLLAMLQCGNNAPQRAAAVQQEPPDGSHFRRETLAPDIHLGFNLKTMA